LFRGLENKGERFQLLSVERRHLQFYALTANHDATISDHNANISHSGTVVLNNGTVV